MAEDDRNSSTGGSNVPLGKTHKLPIHIQQAQDVNLMIPWVLKRVRNAVAGVVARLRRGRPREYDHDAITKVAEDLARETGVDDDLDPFCVRVRNECKNKRPRIKTPKSRSQMRKICRLTWEGARVDN
jgi:hypothetical protein